MNTCSAVWCVSDSRAAISLTTERERSRNCFIDLLRLRWTAMKFHGACILQGKNRIFEAFLTQPLRSTSAQDRRLGVHSSRQYEKCAAFYYAIRRTLYRRWRSHADYSSILTLFQPLRLEARKMEESGGIWIFYSRRCSRSFRGDLQGARRSLFSVLRIAFRRCRKHASRARLKVLSMSHCEIDES